MHLSLGAQTFCCFPGGHVCAHNKNLPGFQDWLFLRLFSSLVKGLRRKWEEKRDCCIPPFQCLSSCFSASSSGGHIQVSDEFTILRESWISLPALLSRFGQSAYCPACHFMTQPCSMQMSSKAWSKRMTHGLIRMQHPFWWSCGLFLLLQLQYVDSATQPPL